MIIHNRKGEFCGEKSKKREGKDKREIICRVPENIKTLLPAQAVCGQNKATTCEV